MLAESREATYPPAARDAGREADVVLELTIDTQGHVTAARVVTPVGDGFDEAALEAVRGFVFRPARRGGKAVGSRIRYVHTFRLTPPAPGAPPPAAPEAPSPAVPPPAPAATAPAPEAPPDEVAVQGERAAREVVRRSLDREELRTMPGTNGDPLRAAQALPGVARPPAFSDQIVVRGSSPRSTQIFIDGVFVPQAFHFGGLSTVIPAEMLDRVDFYPGNYPSRYGRVTGGVIDMVARSPAPDGRTHAVGQVDMLDGRVFAEGTVPGSSMRFAIGARRSWVDAWLGPVLSSAGSGVRTAPYYYDGQAFLEGKPSAHTVLRVGMYTSSDALSLVSGSSSGEAAFAGGQSSSTSFTRVQGSLRGELSPRTRFSAMLAIGPTNQDASVGSVRVKVRTDLVSGRAEVTHELTPWWSLRGGLDVIAGTGDVALRVPPEQPPGQPDPGPVSGRPFLTSRDHITSNRTGVFVETELRPSRRLLVTLGQRWDATTENGNSDWSPRANARWDIRRGPFATALRGGIGLFHESVDYGDLASSQGASWLRSSRALQGSLGLEQTLGAAATLSVEGFVKRLSRLASYDPAREGPRHNANQGTGEVRGLEVLLRTRELGRVRGYLAYTLSRSTRRDTPDAATRLFEYDQTHVLTATAAVRLGRGFTLGARYRYATGNPYTPCRGGSFAADAGVYACVAGAPYSARLPAFSQLDARIERLWQFTDWRLTVYLDVQNATNRGNSDSVVTKFDQSSSAPQKSLPILPILGIRGEF